MRGPPLIVVGGVKGSKFFEFRNFEILELLNFWKSNFWKNHIFRLQFEFNSATPSNLRRERKKTQRVCTCKVYCSFFLLPSAFWFTWKFLRKNFHCITIFISCFWKRKFPTWKKPDAIYSRNTKISHLNNRGFSRTAYLTRIARQVWCVHTILLLFFSFFSKFSLRFRSFYRNDSPLPVFFRFSKLIKI